MDDHMIGDPVAGERGEWVVEDPEYVGIYLGVSAHYGFAVTLCTGHPTHPEKVGRVWTYCGDRYIKWGRVERGRYGDSV